MKKIIIGTIVGAIIFFAYQSLAWVGGFHNDFSTYSAGQDAALQTMIDNHMSDGLHVLPEPDPAVFKDHKKAHEEMEKNVGKPWAMVFYHSSMHPEDPSMIMKGFLHSLLAVLLVTLVLYYGNFSSFGSRFLTGWAFGLFAIIQCTMSDMNWWGFPWSFAKAQLIDLTLGWGICCIWLAWYIKRATPKTT